MSELRKQAEIAVRVLTVFRGAALLLDEVQRCFVVLPVFGVLRAMRCCFATGAGVM